MGSLPDNFYGKLRKLENYAKQTVKIYPDRTGTINAGDTIRLTLPKNTLVNLDSFLMYFKGTAVGRGQEVKLIPAAGEDPEYYEDTQFIGRRFPRNTASIIDTLSVSINGQRVCSINEYGHIFNVLYDMSSCIENNHSGKRYLENTDPSSYSEIDLTTEVLTRKVAVASEVSTDTSDKDRDFCISSWLGFLGSASSRVIDTGILGEVQIELRLNPPSILWTTSDIDDSGVSPLIPPSYTLNNVFFTIDRITFNDPTYYEIQAAGLNSEGIPLAFKTFSSHRGAINNKAISHSFNVNSQKLNRLIGTMIPDWFNSEAKLFIQNANELTDHTTQLSAIANNMATLFNQSGYFVKNGVGVETSQFEVNNVATTPAPLTQKEIFNQNMIALGIKDDMNGGIHAGCYDLNSWSQYYFSHFVDFNHQQNTSDFFIEGLDGRSSSINVKWNTTKNDANNGACYPIVFAEMTKLITVNAGQQISMIY